MSMDSLALLGGVRCSVSSLIETHNALVTRENGSERVLASISDLLLLVVEYIEYRLQDLGVIGAASLKNVLQQLLLAGVFDNLGLRSPSSTGGGRLIELSFDRYV
jgi:hypothetical protein